MSHEKYIKYKNKYNNLKKLLLNMTGGTLATDIERLRNNDPEFKILEHSEPDQNIDPQDLANLAEALNTNIYLEQLNLKNSGMDTTEMNILFTALIRNKHLKILNISSNINIYSEGRNNNFALACKNLLINNTSLQVLDICNSYLTDAGINIILEGLKTNINIIELKILYREVPNLRRPLKGVS